MKKVAKERRLYKVKQNEQPVNGYTNDRTDTVALELYNDSKKYFSALNVVKNGCTRFQLAVVLRSMNFTYYAGVDWDQLAEEFIRYYKEDIKPYENK